MKAEDSQTVDACTEVPGQNPGGVVAGAEAVATTHTRTKAGSDGLMEAVVSRGNLMLAYERVMRNKGSAGVDGIGPPEFKAHLQRHWPTIRARLLAGEYMPSPVRRVDIPKPQGGVRTLGIPTLTDRLIQQALHQVLSPIFEPTFSAYSYGFRPGRNAHQAVLQAQRYVAEGHRMVVDLDLEKFFDRVNHDLLMGRLAKKITDRRGHKFCRYADDCNIYVRSQTGFVVSRLYNVCNSGGAVYLGALCLLRGGDDTKTASSESGIGSHIDNLSG